MREGSQGVALQIDHVADRFARSGPVRVTDRIPAHAIDIDRDRLAAPNKAS